MNRKIEAARNYHERTKHSAASLRASGHSLDWSIRPRPFKIYPHIEPLPLPRAPSSYRMPALAAIAASNTPADDQPRVPDLHSLARVLRWSAGIMRTKVYPGGEEYAFRAAACTGALYHIDLYVICGDLPGLAAGVYHFGVHNFALYRLRDGDHRGVLVGATAAEPSLRHAPVVVACASTYWRNSWKYRARTYRHCFWDSGTLLANLLGVAAAEELPATLITGFADATVSALLGLDAEREGTLALVSLGHDPHSTLTPTRTPALISPDTMPVSSREVDYPAIREMHSASALRTPEEVREWRAAGTAVLQTAEAREPPPRGQSVPLRPLDEAAVPPDAIDAVIRRRGSARRFAATPIQCEQLSTMLERATRGLGWNDVYVVVNAVHGLAAGTYAYHREHNALELLRAGSLRQEAGYLALGQELAAAASANIYFLCDLEPLLHRLGNRGYRVAQLAAAVAGGRLYLAAYALRLGATGLTFFDDAVTEFFSPHAAGKSVMFLVAVGHGR